MFDNEGHAELAPELFRQIVRERSFEYLINGILTRATPRLFDTLAWHVEFAGKVADAVSVHPRNIVIRGSTLLGYSLRPDRFGRPIHEESDIDLAIIDPDYYHVIDRQIRYLESQGKLHRKLRDNEAKRNRRKEFRKFYCYRYFDLPGIPMIQEQDRQLGKIADALPTKRIISTFVFRDWLSLFSKWKRELVEIEYPPYQEPPIRLA